jgi:hypothetical protein
MIKEFGGEVKGELAILYLEFICHPSESWDPGDGQKKERIKY